MAENDSIELYFLRVNHGDSILLRLPDLSWGIIDCSRQSSDTDIYVPALRVLKNLNAKEISFLCLTHPHADHYRGFSEIFKYTNKNKIPIKKFVISVMFHNLSKYAKLFEEGEFESDSYDDSEFNIFFKELYKKCTNKKAKTIFASNYDTEVYKNDDISIRTLSPDCYDHISYEFKLDSLSSLVEKRQKIHNRISIVLQITYGKNSIILGGDAEQKSWEEIFENNIDKNEVPLKAEVLKVSHHGSQTNISIKKNIFNELHTKNSFGVIFSSSVYDELPHDDVIEIMKREDSRFYPLCTNASKNCFKKMKTDLLDERFIVYKDHDKKEISELNRQRKNNVCFGNIKMKLTKEGVSEITTSDKKICECFGGIMPNIKIKSDKELWKRILSS